MLTTPAGGADPAQLADSTPPASGRPVRIGVVFVHGIGKQSQSETVREFAEPLYDWVTRWFRARTGFLTIDKVELSYGNALGDTPARYELNIPAVGPHPAQTWVLTEGFWADRLTPPSLKTMLKWGGKTIVPVVLTLAGNCVRQPLARARWIFSHLRDENASIGRIALALLGTAIDFVSQMFLLLGYLIGGLVVGPSLIVLLLPAAVLPIPQLQDFVLVRILAPILTEWIGDFEVYTDDLLVARHMRNGILHAIQWLSDPKRGSCETVCVIGHSGGGLISFDVSVNEPAAADAVTKLITMGSALNVASYQERERRRGLERRWPHATFPPVLFQGNTRPDLHWVDMWAAYDPVAMGGFSGAGAQPNDDIPATNEMNVLTDHGAYFRNDEEVISLWAQEISTPRRARQRSRFWLDDYDRRVQRRWDRVITLVAWRLTGIFLFVGVALARRDHMVDDGRRIWGALNQLPAVEGLAGVLSGVFEALSRIFGGLADATAWLPAIAVVFRFFRELLRPSGLEPLVSTAIATLVIGGAFLLFYWLVTLFAYEPWRRVERVESVYQELPARSAGDRVVIWARALGVPLVFAAFAWLVLFA